MARKSHLLNLNQLRAFTEDALGGGSALGRKYASQEARKGFVRIEKAIEDAARREVGATLDAYLDGLDIRTDSEVGTWSVDGHHFGAIKVWADMATGRACQFTATRLRIREASTVDGVTTPALWSTYVWTVDAQNNSDTSDDRNRMESTKADQAVRARFGVNDARTIVTSADGRTILGSINPIGRNETVSVEAFDSVESVEMSDEMSNETVSATVDSETEI